MSIQLILVTTGTDEDYAVRGLLSGDGDPAVLWAEFEQHLRDEIARDSIPGTHYDMVQAAGKRLGYSKHDYDYVSAYFINWLITHKGFVALEYTEQYADDIEITGQ